MNMTIRKAITAAALTIMATIGTSGVAMAQDVVVPCGSDADCFVKNPTIRGGYGTEKFFDAEWVVVNGVIVRIEEDDPRWNCQTMGNHICDELVNGEWMLNHFSPYGTHEYLYSTPRDMSIVSE